MLISTTQGGRPRGRSPSFFAHSPSRPACMWRILGPVRNPEEKSPPNHLSSAGLRSRVPEWCPSGRTICLAPFGRQQSDEGHSLGKPSAPNVVDRRSTKPIACKVPLANSPTPGLADRKSTAGNSSRVSRAKSACTGTANSSAMAWIGALYLALDFLQLDIAAPLDFLLCELHDRGRRELQQR